MVITVDISPDKTILENGDKAIIFHSDPFRYDINTSYGVIKNIVTSINLSDCGMESKYKNSNISKKARKALKNLEIFTPKLFSSKSFNKENVKEEIISDSLGKGKLLNISLQFINPNFEGILFGKLIVKLYEHDIKKTNTSSITISVEINNWEKFKTNTSIHSISPLFLDEKGTWEVEKNYFPDSRAITFLKNGYQSWSISDLLYHNDKAGETPTSLGQMFGMHNYDKTIKCRFYSDMVGAITDLETQKSIIMGFISNENQYGQILMDRIEKSSFSFLMALCQFDFIKLENLKDKKVKSEELFVDLSSSMQGQLLLNDWALLTGIKMKSRILSLTENNIQINKEYNVLSGWCSWYYYYTKISEEKMVKNIDFLAKHTEFPIDIIQLDDGYQTEVGDFTSINEKFPNGLKWLVDKIHISHGMAGLWIAPFFAQDKSMLFKEHPEWFLKDKNGELVKTGRNWGSYLYALDLSMEVVIDHIKSLIKTIINEWGFDFIKIDFIYASEDIKVIYNDSSLTRAQILRRGVQAIRDSMGDKILLGCGAPLGPCIGLVDVMRIGCDTAANWIAAGSLGKFVHNKIKVEIPALKPALVATVMRSYMHNSLWFNDPDCCVVREKNSKLSLNEIKLQLTIFGLSGGQVFFSDDLKLLDEERLKYMNLIIPPYKKGGTALDILSEYPPKKFGMLNNSSIGDRILMALINWDRIDRADSFYIEDIIKCLNSDIKSDEYFIFDFWSQKEIKLLGKFKTDKRSHINNIPGHMCKYLSLIPIKKWSAGEPIFLSSNLHISQGCKEVSKFEFNNKKLTIEFEIKGIRSGEISLLIPKNLVLQNNQSEIKKFETEYGLYVEISINLPKDKKIELLFN